MPSNFRHTRQNQSMFREQEAPGILRNLVYEIRWKICLLISPCHIELIAELADYCKVRKIEFMSTPFSVSDAEAINPFVRIHKIASYEISHIRLIEYVAHTGKPLILSTGACDYEDIEWAMNCFYDSGGKTYPYYKHLQRDTRQKLER